MPKKQPIHIGEIIKQVLKDKNISVAELGRRIGKLPNSVQHIFRSQSIDIELLIEIGKALDYNFLQVYTGQSQGIKKISLMIVYNDGTSTEQILSGS